MASHQAIRLGRELIEQQPSYRQTLVSACADERLRLRQALEEIGKK